MELYLKKYFWVVPILVVMVCAVLAAKGVNHVIEAKYLLGESRAKSGGARAGGRKPTDVAKPPPSKDAEVVVTRNVFCSKCLPPVPEPTTAPEGPHSDEPQPTSLPLALLATFTARDEVSSSATISNTSSNRSGSYWLHDEIPEAGEIVRITTRYVDFRNRSSNRLERIDLMGGGGAGSPPPAAPRPSEVARPSGPTPTGPEAELLAQMDSGVKKIDDTHYEIERALVDKVLSDPNVLARSARIVPSMVGGKPNGFKMYAIRPNSPFGKLGFQNGDTINAVNGYEITSMETGMQVFLKLKSASNVAITMTRRGQPHNMEFSVK